MLFTFWSMIWKERNTRIFEHREISDQRLAVLIQEAILLNHSAIFEHKEISAQRLAVLIQEAILLNHSALALSAL
jgi:hypothetical protein